MTNVKIEKTFIKKYNIFLYLEDIIMNEKRRNRKYFSDDYEIDWTKIAILVMYNLNIFSYKNSSDKSDALNLLREHKEEISWEQLYDKHFSNINKDFLIEFLDIINWHILLNMDIEDGIDEEIIENLLEHNILSIEELSSMNIIPNGILIKYADEINWNKVLEKHTIQDIPVECLDHDKLIIAIRNNPDLINIRGDKQSISELNARLKKYVWIDRVAGVEGHYQDDTGLWVDTLRGEAADDADNLESDLEHDVKDAYGETLIKDEEDIELE